MDKEELLKLSDQELLDKAKEMRSGSIVHALLIGSMIGVVIFSVASNSWGFFTLIPLFLAFRVFHNPKNNEANQVLKEVLKERNLS